MSGSERLTIHLTLKGHPGSRALVEFAELSFGMHHKSTFASAHFCLFPFPQKCRSWEHSPKHSLYANLHLRICFLGNLTSKPRRYLFIHCEETGKSNQQAKEIHSFFTVKKLWNQEHHGSLLNPGHLSSWSGSCSVMLFNSVHDNWMSYGKPREESGMPKEY